MSKRIKKVVSFILVLTLLFSISVTTVLASSTKTNNINQRNYTSTQFKEIIINSVEKNMYFSKKHGFIVNKDRLINDLSKLNIIKLQRTAESLGVFYQKNMTVESLCDTIVTHIESVNDEISNGKLKRLKNGTLIDTTDDAFYLQGGSTYDLTFWWGKTRFMSTSAANRWVRDLNKSAAANAGVATIAGVVFGGIGAIPNGLTGAYCWYLASDAAYYNSLSSRGIKTDITWLLFYSMDTQ